MQGKETRHLDWEGCFNVRDLGGLPTIDGGRTKWGALVRADSLGTLTRSGWDQLYRHGVRTVIDLRNEEEREPDVASRPAAVRTIHLPLDVNEDRDFWAKWESGPQFATPLYYAPHLRRFSRRSAEVIAAVANAEPGGVAFHCVGGRDRSGQVAMLILALVGVAPQEIAADYVLSADRLPALYLARGEEDPAPILDAFLRKRGTRASKVVVETLESLDIEATLREGGLSDADLQALHSRVLRS